MDSNSIRMSKSVFIRLFLSRFNHICVSSQPSPACLVLWSTCRRITTTGSIWTRWSVRVCVLLLLSDSPSCPSPRAGWDSDRSSAVEQLVSSVVIWLDWALSAVTPDTQTAGDWAPRFSLQSQPLFLCGSQWRLLALLRIPYTTCVDLKAHLTICTIQHNTPQNLHFS